MAIPENPIADYPVTVLSMGVTPVIYASEFVLSQAPSSTVNVIGNEPSGPPADQIFEVTISAVLDALIYPTGRVDWIIQSVVDSSIPVWFEVLRFGLLANSANRLSGIHLPGRYVRFRCQNYEVSSIAVNGFMLFRALNVGVA